MFSVRSVWSWARVPLVYIWGVGGGLRPIHSQKDPIQSLVRRIQSRFVVILQHMPPRKKVTTSVVEVVKPDVPPFDMKSAIACSSHSIVTAPDGTSLSCRGCGAKVSSSAGLCKDWLATSCPSPFNTSNQLKYQQKQLGNSIQVGSTMVHISH